ncbi:tetratricopeptide repeat protein [Roseiflexus sp.]|uniref:tetratricopeptide repeat protein n=1 Tax=Roseiflexus sp. TaxID=2562120 RepID=UPI00258E6EA0|nr:tetratricopeptide repeat protein [Roseiflexus sp.]
MTLTRQDEKFRLQRRLQNQAVELAVNSRWEEAVQVNEKLIGLAETTETYNRLGKAYFELGRLTEARDAYRNALRLTPNNRIARRNLERIEELLARSASLSPVSLKAGRQLVDLRLFVTEVGKTALTSLIDVQRGPALAAIVTGEKVELRPEGRGVAVYDTSGALIGRIEPKLAQRLNELMDGGNRYIAAVAHIDGRQVRIIIRETYQAPSQRGRVSFPGKLSESALRGAFISGAQFDEFGEELLEEEEGAEVREDVDEEAFGGEDEELGLEEIEPDIGDDEDLIEE